MLFLHRDCLECRHVRESILVDPQVRRALNEITWQSVDTATPEGAHIASHYRVDATPVLVLFSGDGREIARTDDLATMEKFLEAIGRLD